MKPKLQASAALILVFLFVINSSFATIRRIGYWGTAIANVDYASADLAVTAAANGDTIHVYPNSSTWTFNNLNKTLVIIGTGYYHYPGANGATNFNAHLQAVQPASLCSFYFNPGCDGTVITGCDITTSFTAGTSGINNVKITNCRISSNLAFNTSYTFDGWEISKSEINGTGIYNYSNTAKLTNLKLFNCLIGSYGIYQLSTASGQTGIIENCTFAGNAPNFSAQSFMVQNCVFLSGISGYSNCVFNNNIFTNSPSPVVTGANNILNASSASLFVGYPAQGTYSNDERYKLKPGSPALGAGANGADCGAFGGVNPYKLSGIPAVPAIYKLTAPSNAASANPYTITFSVRANN